MIKLSYSELPRICQETMQFIAGRINATVQYAPDKWNEIHDVLMKAGGIDALHCTGAMYRRNWQFKQKFDIETWITVMNTFKMYDSDNKAALAVVVLGQREWKI